MNCTIPIGRPVVVLPQEFVSIFDLRPLVARKSKPHCSAERSLCFVIDLINLIPFIEGLKVFIHSTAFLSISIYCYGTNEN